MDTEIEVKFLYIDHDDFRQKLREIGAVCEKPMRLMRRVTFENAAMKAKNGWIRVRDEGDKVTVAYKQTDAFTIDGTKEIETVVTNFDTMVKIFEQIELSGGSFQESKRESWRYQSVQIELDEWPWLDPYIEIEASNQEDIEHIASLLGLSMGDAVAGDVMVAYRAQYPHLGTHDTVGNLARVTFDTPLPEMFSTIER